MIACSAWNGHNVHCRNLCSISSLVPKPFTCGRIRLSLVQYPRFRIRFSLRKTQGERVEQILAVAGTTCGVAYRSSHSSQQGWFLSVMSQRRFLSTNQPTHTLPGRDSVRSPESSLTRPLGVAETSEISTPNYSKHPSGKFKFSLLICVKFVSLLPVICWGRIYSLEDTCRSWWSFPRAHQS